MKQVNISVPFLRFLYLYLHLFVCFRYLADQGDGSPALQTYEIPLDYSVGIQRASYIGTKKVAPKADERRVVKYSKPKKQRRKGKHDLAGDTLPITGRRDHIYSSVNDEVTNTLSEGTNVQGEVNFVWALFAVNNIQLGS